MNDQILADVEARLLRYVQIDTQSDEATGEVPSTAKQWALLNLLRDELIELGAADVAVADYGCTFATIPATSGLDEAPTVAFLAHVDTAPQFSGTNVQPLVHRDYDGAPITLPDDPQQQLSPDNSPALRDKIGHTLITASGKTLLGADDKAGVAIIMSLAKYLLEHPDIVHCPLRLCFTSDEEIGVGIRRLKVDDLGADVAYTLDGALPGEIVYETFSADGAKVKITGVSIHPGSATGKMVNALHLAAKFIELLPQATRSPATTSERQGFIHATTMNGSAASAEISLILRAFEPDELAAHGDFIQSLCETLRQHEPRAQIECENQRAISQHALLAGDRHAPVELAREAIAARGLEPHSPAIRGGTDGSQLTAMGVPTPNCLPACRISTARWSGSAYRIWGRRWRSVWNWRSCGAKHRQRDKTSVD